MDWSQVLTVFAVVIANLTTVIILYCHLDNKTNGLIQVIREDVKAISNEMKDFHGRLERQDAEFKAHLMHYHEGKK